MRSLRNGESRKAEYGFYCAPPGRFRAKTSPTRPLGFGFDTRGQMEVEETLVREEMGVNLPKMLRG